MEKIGDLLDKYTTVVTDRKSNYIGYFASFTYGFDERYILTASFRSDASNRFGQDTRNRFLPVWSIGGRWNVHYEPWMQNQQVISDLNFRVSYGWKCGRKLWTRFNCSDRKWNRDDRSKPNR